MSAEQVQMVSPETVKAWMDAGDCLLIDVREAEEYAQARIPGAHLMALSSFDPAAVPANPPGKLVIHCRSGNRCGMASMRLLEAGYKGRIHRMEGGILNWHNKGLPVEAGRS